MPSVHQGAFTAQRVCLTHWSLQPAPGPSSLLMHAPPVCASGFTWKKHCTASLLQGSFALALASSPSVFLSEPLTVTEDASAEEESPAAGGSLSKARRLAQAQSELEDPVPPAPPTPPSPPTPGGGFLCGHCNTIPLRGSCAAQQCECTRAGCCSQLPGPAT